MWLSNENDSDDGSNNDSDNFDNASDNDNNNNNILVKFSIITYLTDAGFRGFVSCSAHN